VLNKVRNFFSHFIHFMIPKSIFILLKINLHCFHAFWGYLYIFITGTSEVLAIHYMTHHENGFPCSRFWRLQWSYQSWLIMNIEFWGVSSPLCWFNNKEFPCITHTVEHNYISPSSTVGIQLHVSSQYVGHLQVVI